jgi:hypothetical protein
MATLILTAVGTAVGGPLGGALGALLGRSVDQMVIGGGRREGPRIADLHVQTSAYGSQIPRIFGTMRVAGTVIWATDLKETRIRSGGGKGQPGVTQYRYTASFAVALSSRRAPGVRRIWADGNLLRGSAGDFKTAVGAFRFHDGGPDQPPDPLIAAAQGPGATPAHRGTAYALFEDLALEDFGNRIPSLTFELVADEGDVALSAIARDVSDGGVDAAVDARVGGYAASGESLRAALSPLVENEGLSVGIGEQGLLLSRWGADEESRLVAREQLAAKLDGNARDSLKRTRQTAETVPARLSVRHYDPARDYQAGVQQAVRAGPGRREAGIDLPAVIAAVAARRSAERRLADRWAGRSRIALTCDWRALTLPAGTRVRMEGEPGLWAVEDREWEAMGVSLRLRRLADGAAVPATAASGAALSQPDLPHGPTTLMLMDLPPLGDAAPTRADVEVAAAGASAGWRRAALFVVEPGSASLTDMGVTGLPADMGRVVVPPGDGPSTLFDDRAFLDVEMLADDMPLSGADDAALDRGANLCLAGRELLQFGAVDRIGPRRYRLTRLLRGRRGTEWARATHLADEPFVLIAADRMAPVPDGAIPLGGTVTVAAIGIGDAAPVEAMLDVRGEALIPLSPVHPRIVPDGAGGLAVRWTRRSRSGWRWADHVDTPLGEEAERYVVIVSDGDIVVRQHETTVAQWSYDADMAAADAAAGHGGPLTLSVHQLGTFARGRAAQAPLMA